MNTVMFSYIKSIIVKKFFLLIILLFLAEISFGQISLDGDIEKYFENFYSSMPAGNFTNEYQSPSASQLYIWENAVKNIMEYNFSSAQEFAAQIGYQVIAFTDTTLSPERTLYILERNNSNNHWGIFIFNPSASRPRFVLQCPHPRNDTNTGFEGVLIFKEANAGAIFVSGTHRCNSTVYSSCSGTTTTCSATSEPYRISDHAHYTESTFQKTTEVMLQYIPELIVIHLHGFAKGSTDPDLIMGNGRYIYPTGTDYLVLLRENFKILDPTLTYKISHVDNWTRLAGTTNVQGRLINGNDNPCANNNNVPNGRFLHIEQAYSKLRSSRENWKKVAKAVTMTFPEDATHIRAATEETSPSSFYLSQNYPNPFNSSTNIEFYIPVTSNIQLKIFDVLGREITSVLNETRSPGKYNVVIESSALTSGIYYCVFQADGFRNTKKMIILN